ncbi:MAG: hypothetical protein BAA04_05670 [Firmicutes bacterium ZCTH02-B6]|nr:MAG: hypothetical protein BAA04_05670 [Firmicutes bacterium ZCTH02-B6]
MLGWSRFESWLAVVLSVLLVSGAIGHVVLGRRWGAERGPVAIETIEAAAPRAEATFNLAAPAGDRCADGEEATTAAASLPGAAGEPSGQVADMEHRININLAQASELERLPGIGPALARRIVEYREQWGPFDDIADILEVPGIGPAKFRAIQDLIRVE